MPDSFFLIIDLAALAGAIGIFIWWVVRRRQWKNQPPNIGFRFLVSVVLGATLIAIAHGMGFSYGGAFVVPFSCLLFGILMSVLWAPYVGEWVARPFTSLFDGGSQKLEPQPLYSIAQAKRKKGQYHEAVFAIHQQLQKFPNDLAGQILLAEIQAENLNDLPGAQLTIERLCQQSGHAPAQRALALNQLADWHLKFGQDIEAARQALEKILALF